MTVLDRRGFVKMGASGTALLVLPFARGEGYNPLAASPDWAQFRGEMKKRNQPGVIVLLPAAEHCPSGKAPAEDLKRKQIAAVPQQAECNAQLATEVNTLLFSCGDSELPHMLVQAVFVAAPANQVHKEFPTLPTGAGIALIGVDGRVHGSLPAELEMGKKFAERAGQLLYGKNDNLLAERVKAERAALGEANCKKLDEALADLDHDEFGRRQQASHTLAGLFARVHASLAQAYRGAPSMEVRARIDTLFRKKLHDDNTAALLQASLAPHVAAANFNPRVRCGQGALRAEAHAFVQLWCEQAG